MKFTRRRFIGTLGASAVAAASIGSAGKIFGQSAAADDLFFPSAASEADPLSYLTSKHFEPFINTAFKVGSGKMSDPQLVLKEVNQFKRKLNIEQGYSGESFSLIFEGSRTKKITPGNLDLRHPELGNLSFLVVPVGQTDTCFEVIVNRVNR